MKGIKKQEGTMNIEDLDYIQLADKRLKKRLVRSGEQVSAAPMSSLPQACGAWHEVKGAYRFLITTVSRPPSW